MHPGRSGREVLVSDTVFHMAGDEDLKARGHQPGQLGVVPDHLFFRTGVFPSGQHRSGRVQGLGGNAANHPVDVRGIGAHQPAQSRSSLQLVALGHKGS